MICYKHTFNNGFIFVVSVCGFSDETIYCIHFDTGLYIELQEKPFKFFIEGYKEKNLNKEEFKKVFSNTTKERYRKPFYN